MKTIEATRKRYKATRALGLSCAVLSLFLFLIAGEDDGRVLPAAVMVVALVLLAYSRIGRWWNNS